MSGLNGKAAVVTGGASGIGAAVVRRLVSEGVSVCALDISEEGLDKLAASLDRPIRTAVADVTNEEQVAHAISSAAFAFGQLDLVFNIAGGQRFGSILDGSTDDWFATLQLVLGGTYFGIRHGGRAIRDAGNGGAIVNVASLNAHIPSVLISAYATGKAAVEHLTKNAALELAPFGIRVNAVLPGLVDTPLTAPVMALPALQQDFISRILLGRCAEPDDIAGPCVYLAGEDARYITGTSLMVDGGWEISNYPVLTNYL